MSDTFDHEADAWDSLNDSNDGRLFGRLASSRGRIPGGRVGPAPPAAPDEFPDEDPNSWIDETEDEHQRIVDELGEADSDERDPVALTKMLVDFWNAARSLA